MPCGEKSKYTALGKLKNPVWSGGWSSHEAGSSESLSDQWSDSSGARLRAGSSSWTNGQALFTRIRDEQGLFGQLVDPAVLLWVSCPRSVTACVSVTERRSISCHTHNISSVLTLKCAQLQANGADCDKEYCLKN